MNHDELNWAAGMLDWAAGMFEAEGTIRIAKDRSSKSERIYRLQCKVPNTDYSIPKALHRHWQGSTRTESPRGNRQPQLMGEVSGANAERFLRELLPHLRTERVKKKAELARSFQLLKEHSRLNPSNENRSQQRQCYERMNRLNARGAAAKGKRQEE